MGDWAYLLLPPAVGDAPAREEGPEASSKSFLVSSFALSLSLSDILFNMRVVVYGLRSSGSVYE